MREGDVIGGRYMLLERVGRGSFGVVWRAEERLRGEVLGMVAVKEFSAEVDLREMAVLAGLSHPNILGYRTTLEEGQSVCLVTEYAEGGSARDLLRAHPGGVPDEQVKEVLLGAARGLACLHGRGLVHRDIKPDNILLGEGKAMLGDVGTAKALVGSMGVHSGPGSVAYAAPEMFENQVGPKSDVYGLGVTAYELLLGKLPFEGNLAAVMAGHMTREPEIPASLPSRWRELLAGCLAKDPSQRWGLVRMILQLEGKAESDIDLAERTEKLPVTLEENIVEQPEKRSAPEALPPDNRHNKPDQEQDAPPSGLTDKAERHYRNGEYAEAAYEFLKAARVEQAPARLREIFLRLGDIYRTGNSALTEMDISPGKQILIWRRTTDPGQKCLTDGDRYDLRDIWKMPTNRLPPS